MAETNLNRPYTFCDLMNASDDLKYATGEHNKTKISVDNARKSLTDAEKAEAEIAKLVESKKKIILKIIAHLEK